ncbi:HPr-rel-A system PqqD family peptide chaperone [Sphingomonas qomolangmaensis]|uniref:HPr-rel-A system PqqD family peptide chaperone n=1 Tax=Sphingomonas qomolangmaensis TaxID=2918765 RepID=A0ABY5L7P4_9SPHN|nr:HPr-rel-A system PqqD family peptide chaperone [Sphingomonas qomolangmaensis]UUL82990.1 HPr-rel-A system PqqD family peptide chaperone [Sphingomonas qomolangmaensis]
MPARYRASAGAALRIVPLDLLTLIYHRASGQTHVVASPVPEILETLATEAMDVAALLAKLTATYDLGDADAEAMAARLDELAAVGLVERG